MPIKIPDSLPARQYLEGEGLVVMRESEASRQDIRPLRIALLNLMPLKEKTELHFSRLIGATPLQVELTLLTTGSYTPTNVSKEHMLAFYQSWEEVKDQKYDGLIITGAPVETLDFKDVIYWSEMESILEWTQTNVFNTLNICWGAQAALYHFHDVPKHELTEKRFGIYPHKVVKKHSVLLRGFDDEFMVPVSRHTENRAADLPAEANLEVLAESEDAGLCVLRDHDKRQVYMFNHLEYDSTTLKDEYDRDARQGLDITVPLNYYPDDDPTKMPPNLWRSHAHLFISNWINDVYQRTPFDLNDIGK
ncbi:homoserine O-succinyltransferase [Curvivirga sp.]|uniref:homoserine O-succinyltransferase n=1 Tax=Curvivirga sp. TaxID=2856848 RepID=UPI003B5A3E35